MKRARILALISGLLAASPVIGAPSLSDWSDIADACEALITTQDISVFEGYTPVAPVDPLVSVTEVAFQNPRSGLIAQAVAMDGDWFVCTGRADAPMILSETSPVLSQWRDHQRTRIATGHHEAVFFGDARTISPGRVHCRGNGAFTVTFGFIFGDNEFRVGAANSLPRKVTTPCT